MLTAETSYAQLFASRGANVVVNDVSKDAADKVVASITKGICQQSIRIASHTHVSQLEARPSRTLPLLQMEHQSYKQQLPNSVASVSSLTMLGYYGLSLKLLVLPYLCSLGQLGTEQRQEASPLKKHQSLLDQCICLYVQFQEYVGSRVGHGSVGTPQRSILLYKGCLALLHQTEIWTRYQHRECCRIIRLVCIHNRPRC